MGDLFPGEKCRLILSLQTDLEAVLEFENFQNN